MLVVIVKWFSHNVACADLSQWQIKDEGPPSRRCTTKLPNVKSQTSWQVWLIQQKDIFVSIAARYCKGHFNLWAMLTPILWQWLCIDCLAIVITVHCNCEIDRLLAKRWTRAYLVCYSTNLSKLELWTYCCINIINYAMNYFHLIVYIFQLWLIPEALPTETNTTVICHLRRHMQL